MEIENMAKTGIICVAALLFFLIIMAVLTADSNRVASSAYRDKCREAGGIFIDANGEDFCVKEFMPLGGGK